MAKRPPPGFHPKAFEPIIPKLPSFYRVPVFGQWARRIGQVEQILATPCTDDPLLWIEGFFFNVPKLLWSFVSPDLNDSYFNRAGRKHGGKRGFTFNMEGFIEGEATDVELPGWGKFLFRLGALAQRVGFWFMVVDATSDFLLNWVSTVYQWAGCKATTGAWAKGTNIGGVAVPNFPNQRLLIGATIEGDGRLIAPGGTGIIQTDRMKAAAIGFTIKTAPFIGTLPVGVITAHLVNQAGELVASTGEITVNDENRGTASAWFNAAHISTAFETYEIRFDCAGGYADLTGSSAWINESPTNGIDPGFGQSIKFQELPFANPLTP